MVGAELENEIEARQQQTPESLRGVHEQVIKLVDNLVQNYLGNVRRAVQRMTNFIDNRRSTLNGNQPRRSASYEIETGSALTAHGNIIIGQAHSLSKSVQAFGAEWSQLVGRQQSPLFDRIPPRGVELWRDFWDTVRKQVRRINQEVWQLSRDMGRMITGRLPSNANYGQQDANNGSLLYTNDKQMTALEQLKALYEKMSITIGEQQQKMDSLHRVSQAQEAEFNNNLIDENDDEATRKELTRNVALRQQIQQEINVFGSIFDIMRTFIQRLRESASNIRDVLQPNLGNINNNDNNAVTPGPSVKPQVDKLLDETIDSQRNINSQAKPVLLPNDRPSLNRRD